MPEAPVPEAPVPEAPAHGPIAPRQEPLAARGLARGIKACLDRGAAAALLLLCAPVMALIALWIRATMGAPVWFRQPRLGRGEKIFVLVKFRTMHRGRAKSDAERLTALGKWLRRTSLDELPQLIHILRGEMSFVGPRPLLVKYKPYYTQPEKKRHSIAPGLTGWAQIHGRNQLGWDRRLALDAWYAEHWSLRLDAEILLRTVGCVLLGRGVEVAPAESMDDLDVERARAELR